ncbi:MAG TPA: tetratricopeptide repeat protein, partial [Candidatus Micrarchaeota archaeon]|nr:tetratricopeptide repeat protein [Candidatus Micrarchaeota archaeon]
LATGLAGAGKTASAQQSKFDWNAKKNLIWADTLSSGKCALDSSKNSLIPNAKNRLMQNASDPLVQKTDSLLEDGKYEQAIAEFKKAIEGNPKNAMLHHDLGAALEYYAYAILDSLGEKKSASLFVRSIQEYGIAISLEPENYSFRVHRASEIANFARDNYETQPKLCAELIQIAIGDLDKVPKSEASWLRPSLAMSLGNLAQLQAEKGQYANALDLYNKAIALHPMSYLAWDAANLFMKTGDYKSARGYYTKTLSLFTKEGFKTKEEYKSTVISVILSRAKASEALKEYGKAIEDYEAAIKINPKDQWQYSQIFNTYFYNLNDWKGAYGIAARFQGVFGYNMLAAEAACYKIKDKIKAASDTLYARGENAKAFELAMLANGIDPGNLGWLRAGIGNNEGNLDFNLKKWLDNIYYTGAAIMWGIALYCIWRWRKEFKSKSNMPGSPNNSGTIQE